MSNISKRWKEGPRAKIKNMGDHDEFLKRITKTLYYGQLPTLPCLSLPVTEISCAAWSVSQRGVSVRRLRAGEAARAARGACVSPCALVLALLYLERLRACNPRYLRDANPTDLFLVSLMVGNKFLQDDGEDDEVICSEWAASGGIELKQLKKLELEFLTAIDWNIFISDKMFETGLQWLERRVALKQALLHGFFTYTDIVAAGVGSLATTATALALLLVSAGGAVGVAAAARFCTFNSLNETPTGLAPPLATHDQSITQGLHTNVFNTNVLERNNETIHLSIETTDFVRPDDIMDLSKPKCCTEWKKYNDIATPKKNWYDSFMAYNWSGLEPWWSKSTLLSWLYQSSMVNPLQRWLGQLDEYAELARRTASSRPPHWLNRTSLNSLLAIVTDR